MPVEWGGACGADSKTGLVCLSLIVGALGGYRTEWQGLCACRLGSQWPVLRTYTQKFWGGMWAANRASWEYLMLVTVHFFGLPKPQDGGQEAYNPKEKGHGQGHQNDFILNFLSTWRVPTWNEFNFRKIRIVCMRAYMRVTFFKYQSLWLVYSF